MADDRERKIIGVVGRKGGSGKTTTSVHVAADLAERGRSVVLVDADPQGSAQLWAAPGQLPMKVLHQPLAPGSDVRSWSRTVRSLNAEFVVIDCAPHLDAGMGASVGISDLVILPCGPSLLDLHALRDTLQLVHAIRAQRSDSGPKITLLPTRVDNRTASGRQLPSVLEREKEDVSPSLHLRMALTDAANGGEWIGSFAPDSPGHNEVRTLGNHLLELLGEKPEKRRK